MQINITYDSSTNAAPSAFFGAITYVVNLFDHLFTNPITLNFDVGYGEVNGTAFTDGSLGHSVTVYDSGYTYANVKAALPFGSLLLNDDPTNGASFYVSKAEELALGLTTSSAIDGWFGFSSTAPFAYDPNSRAVPGLYDFIGIVEHEITEMMGRSSTYPAVGAPAPFDLYRFIANGVLSLKPSGASYFSLNNGATSLDNFNDRSVGGDLWDWGPGAGNDAFNNASASGVVNALTPTDIALMNALGYATAGMGAALPGRALTLSAGTVDAGANFDTVTAIGDGLVVGSSGWLLLDVVAGNVTLSGGTASITVNGSGGAPLIFDNNAASLVYAGGRATVIGGSGPETITASAGGLFWGGTGNLSFSDRGNGPSTVVGGSGSNLMFGSGNATLVGGPGNSTMVGGNVVFGGTGPDVIATVGNETVVAGTGSETIFGAAAGGSGLYFLNGANLFVDGGGSNTLVGGSGATTLFGAAGHTVIFGGTGTIEMVGGSATIVGGKTIMYGTNGTTVSYYGSAAQGAATLVGGGGHEMLNAGGSASNNLLVAGAGDTTMAGGSGSNLFVFTHGNAGGNDVILDFASGRDHVALYGYGGGTPSVAGNTVTLADNTRIAFANGAHLAASDFLFG